MLNVLFSVLWLVPVILYLSLILRTRRATRRTANLLKRLELPPTFLEPEVTISAYWTALTMLSPTQKNGPGELTIVPNSSAPEKSYEF